MPVEDRGADGGEREKKGRRGIAPGNRGRGRKESSTRRETRGRWGENGEDWRRGEEPKRQREDCGEEEETVRRPRRKKGCDVRAPPGRGLRNGKK